MIHMKTLLFVLAYDLIIWGLVSQYLDILLGQVSE
jgi:hypothetical protein